jgi:hypothetical protein
MDAADRDRERHPSGGDPLDRRAGWQPDPTGHYEFRWWDGSTWTNRVAGEGVPTHEGRFAALPPAQRGWGGADIAAYADPDRFAHVFGEITMPTAGLRRWEVVGEGPRQEELDTVAGPKQYEGVWAERVATLRPEPDNPHDDQAVAVEIGGLVVGYLEHTEATAHRRLIDRAIAERGVATCAAVVNGGWFREDEGSEGSYGVHLYFGYGPGAGPEDLPEPVADEERIPYRVRDTHDHITVTGEEHTQDALDAVLGDDWAGDHPFRLARLALGRDPRGREVVGVAIDDRVVGWLTPRMSERFGPALAAAEAADLHLTAAATLEPSRRKGREDEIDVVLRVPRGWGRTGEPADSG